MTPTLTFTCSICGEPSVSICVYCTKDACPNHLCERCLRCSDCCECDIRLDEHPEHEMVYEAPVMAAVHEPTVDEIGIVEIVEDIPIDGHGATALESTIGEPPAEPQASSEPHSPGPHDPVPHNPEPDKPEPEQPEEAQSAEPGHPTFRSPEQA